MNTPVWLQLLPLILSALTLVGSAFAWYMAKGRRRADEASVLTGTALKLVEELQEQVTQIKAELDEERACRVELEKRVRYLERENSRLYEENCELREKLKKNEPD